MVKNVSAYIKRTVLSVQEIRDSNKVTNGPQGTVVSKHQSLCILWRRGSTN